MNRLLRRAANQLRYRALLELVSRTIRLESVVTVPETVRGWLAAQVAWPVRVRGPETKYMGWSVVKYGILDMSFTVEDFEWEARDRGGVELLKELGLAGHARDAGTAPTEEEIQRMIDDCFPDGFVVSDACVTNADFAWFHKHFYM